jgi:hypothetical protein
MKITRRIREEYETLLKKIGERRFFKHVLNYGHLAKKHVKHPENIMLDHSDAFFALFRSTGNVSYFMIGKILRRAAHKLYRHSREKDKDYPINTKFLDIVR